MQHNDNQKIATFAKVNKWLKNIPVFFDRDNRTEDKGKI